MADGSFKIELEGDVFEELKRLSKQFEQLNSKVDKIEENAKSSFKSISQSLKNIDVVAVTQGIENLKNTLEAVNEPGMSFESNMADLSAITGITGDQLDELGQKARENAKTFGGDAASSVETYKLLLSQLGPDLAQTPEVLGSMADSVSILSKTMGGDTTAAVEVLTTAMNQYGVSIDDPIKAQEELNRMMNAMSAGAKEGSAELPQLKAAIQNVGGDARSSGLSFEEMVSSIEALDKAGKKGAEGGVALRNTLASLNQGRFLPKDVQEELSNAGINLQKLSDKSLSFTDRLRALKPIQNDAALLSKLFGKENKLAAEALINSVDAQDKMTAAITNTNTAQEQANVIMETGAEKMARTKAMIDDWKISLYNATGSLMPFIELGFSALQGISTIVPALRVAGKAVNFLASSQNRMIMVQKLGAVWTKAVTAAQWLWNAAMSANPIGLIVIAIGALIAAIVAVIKYYDKWGAALTLVLGPLGLIINLIMAFKKNWDYIKKSFSEGGILAGIKAIGQTIIKAILEPFKQVWSLAKSLVGMGDKSVIGNVFRDGVVATKGNLGSLTPTDKIEALKSKRAEKYGDMPFGKQKKDDRKGAGFSSAEKKEITTNIENLVRIVNISVPELKQSETEIRRYIEEALVSAVRDFEVAIS